jgi:hypothetical protein
VRWDQVPSWYGSGKPAKKKPAKKKPAKKKQAKKKAQKKRKVTKRAKPAKAAKKKVKRKASTKKRTASRKKASKAPPKPKPGGCFAFVHQHVTTRYEMSPGSKGWRAYEAARCSRKGKVELKLGRAKASFCTQHARMARDGFVGKDGMTPDPRALADYRRMADTIHGRPPHAPWEPVAKKPAPRSKVARKRAPATVRRKYSADRIAIPDDTFYEWRDDHAAWPDGWDPEKKWIRYKGKRYWPTTVQQHSFHAFEGAKTLQGAKAHVEFVAAGGPRAKGATKANPDKGWRERQRKAASEGSLESQARILKDRMRKGELQRWHVAMLSLLDHAPAQLLVTKADLHGMVGVRPKQAWAIAWASSKIAPAWAQPQLARIVAVGAALRTLDLCYRPGLGRLRREGPASYLLDPEDPIGLDPLRAVQHYRGVALSGRVWEAPADPGFSASLREAEARFDACDYGGESVMANFAWAAGLLNRFMRKKQAKEGLGSAWAGSEGAMNICTAFRECVERASDFYQDGWYPEGLSAYRATAAAAEASPRDPEWEVVRQGYVGFLEECLLAGSPSTSRFV